MPIYPIIFMMDYMSKFILFKLCQFIFYIWSHLRPNHFSILMIQFKILKHNLVDAPNPHLFDSMLTWIHIVIYLLQLFPVYNWDKFTCKLFSTPTNPIYEFFPHVQINIITCKHSNISTDSIYELFILTIWRYIMLIIPPI